MANLYGVPVHRLAVIEEATSMWAALVGGVAVGLYPGFSMIEEMNQTTETYIPDPAAQSAYEKIYPIFENAYKALVPVFDSIAEL